MLIHVFVTFHSCEAKTIFLYKKNTILYRKKIYETIATCCFAAAPNRVNRDICLTNANQTEKLCRPVNMASYEATQSSHQSITSEDFRSCTASENVQLPSSDVIICTNRRRRTTTGGPKVRPAGPGRMDQRTVLHRPVELLVRCSDQNKMEMNLYFYLNRRKAYRRGRGSLGDPTKHTIEVYAVSRFHR